MRPPVPGFEPVRLFDRLPALRAAVAGLLAAALFGLAPAAHAAKGDPVKGQAVAAGTCAGCHGADGNSAIAANPKLAGQHAEYTAKQLHNFRVKPGAKEAERVNAIMAGMAMTLSEDDIRNVAAFYQQQKLKPAMARSKETAEAGQRIYRAGIPDKGIPSCAGCHGPTGAGIPAQYPRLHGQFAEYTESQLTAFRQGARRNSAQMAAIAARMSDAEIRAVADYIAGLR